ncbi:TonB-dependent receptor plug domain-containing protein [Phnomibacter ginsenosidimutans]|uniref:TonB-dependent receptor plug domain-containing protein n=2 Tax=Phnomibacter ginsenosidimutans TaxID=2676868 RepID=A0A6I6GX40_9BACT|nr:TonB-dependent receptor plug domain-containing protein [Phnomibacter ginsenosidimutans]
MPGAGMAAFMYCWPPVYSPLYLPPLPGKKKLIPLLPNYQSNLRMSMFKIAAGRMLSLRHIVAAFFLLLTTVTVHGQQKTITGVVTNAEDNLPVEKATITVKGTKTAVVADNKGAYSIKAAANQTLVVTAVGFQPMEKTVGQQTVVNFALTAVTSQLESVVVTALGIKRDEKALGYSVTKVGTEELTDAISNNWTNSLTGKVAGINLVKSGGGPAGSNKIILRGENSLDGNSQALIVVDGVVIGSKQWCANRHG